MEQKITVGNVCFIRNPARRQVLLLKRNHEPMQNLYTGVGGKTHCLEDIRTSCQHNPLSFSLYYHTLDPL